MPLVINSLGGGHTHTYTHHRQVISRNQACASQQPVRAWFKNEWHYIPDNRSVLLSNCTILEDYIQGFASYMETLGLKNFAVKTLICLHYIMKKKLLLPEFKH